MATVMELVTASQAAYNTPGSSNNVNMGSNWTPLSISIPQAATSAGYSAAAWVNTVTGEVIIADRGTVPTILGNLRADAELAVHIPPKDYITDAQQFAASAISAAQTLLNGTGVSISAIDLTGHSLGGYLSQIQTAYLSNMVENPLSGIPSVPLINLSINAPGIGGLANTGNHNNYTSYDLYTLGDDVHKGGGSYLDGTQAFVLPYGTSSLDSTGAIAGGIGLLLEANPLTAGVVGTSSLLYGLYNGFYADHGIGLFAQGINGTLLGDMNANGLKGLSQAQITTAGSPVAIYNPQYDSSGYDQYGYNAAGYNIDGFNQSGQIDPKIVVNGGAINTDIHSDGSTETVNIATDGSSTAIRTNADGSVYTYIRNTSGIITNVSATAGGVSINENFDSLTNSFTLTSSQNGITVETGTINVNAQGIKTEVINALDPQGIILNSQTFVTNADQQISDVVSGQGAVVNQEGLNITLAPNAIADILGFGNNVTLGTNASLTVEGTNTVTTPDGVFNNVAAGTQIQTSSDATGTKTTLTNDSGSLYTSATTNPTTGITTQIVYNDPTNSNLQTVTTLNSSGVVLNTSNITQAYDSNSVPIPNEYDITNTDGNGVVLSSGQVIVNPTDGSYTTSLVYPATSSDQDETYRITKTDAAGNTTVVASSAQDAINRALGTVGSSVSVIQDGIAIINGIKTGNTANIVSGLLNGDLAVNELVGQASSPTLTLAADGLNLVSSIHGFEGALKTGNGLAVLSAADNAVTAGAIALSETLTGTSYVGIGAEATTVASATSLAAPFLNIALALQQKDYIQATTQTLGTSIGYYLSAGSPVGAEIGDAIGSLVGRVIEDLFGHSSPPPPPTPYGTATAQWNFSNDTVIAVTGSNVSGGGGVANNELAALEGALVGAATVVSANAQINAIPNENLQLGVIPERLGNISYNGTGSGSFTVSTIDPMTGQTLDPNLVFSATNGLATTGISATDPAYFNNLNQYYLYNALARQAIAPEWEVQTAVDQAANHLTDAGLSETERAADLGHLATPLSADATTQIWNPIGLDLGGGLATTGLANSNVQFNVNGVDNLDAALDGTANPQYLSKTAWLNNKDGFLVEDLNLNGTIDNAQEMFSNSQVAEPYRGIASLATYDVNGSGVINSSDPIFASLGVWVDANSDGVMEKGEFHSLSSLGIASLNYAMGTYTKTDGSVHQMSTLSLQASTSGTSYTAVNDGIEITTTTNTTNPTPTNTQSQYVVTHVDSWGYISTTVPPGSTVPMEKEVIVVPQNQVATILEEGNPNAGTTGLLDGVNINHAPLSAMKIDAINNAAPYPLQVTINSNDTLTVAPFNDSQITDFYYHVNAGTYGQGWVEVEVAVTFVLQPPEPFDQVSPTNPYTGTVFTFIPGAENGAYTGGTSISLAQQPSHGSVTLTSYGLWTYTPNSGSTSADSFVINTTDAAGTTPITINVPAPGSCSNGIDPIIFDLSGTGFDFNPLTNSNVFFQQANDGLSHQTAWFGGGNGVLALNTFGDSIVHDSSQLVTAAGLAALDTNSDGVINASDAAWNKLGIWVDSNQDGIGEVGEFKTLSALGITSINIKGDNQFSVNQGVTINSHYTFTWANGTTGQAADVTLPMSNNVLAPNGNGTNRVTQVAQANPANPMVVGDGNNLVTGDAGDNTITVGNGNNLITTGSGNDLIQVGNGNNTILSGDGQDTIVAGNGDNTISFGAGSKSVFVGDGANTIIGSSGNDIIMAGNGNNLIYAGTGNSLITAGGGNNTLVGGTGYNVLFAGDGDNTLMDGGGRADMHAGIGSNTFNVTNALDTITVAATQGVNTVKTSVNWTLGANQQVLWGTGTAALTLTGNNLGDQLIGNGAADTLIGGAGNDTLADSGGAATLIGGAGDDTYIVTNAATVVVEAANAGNDTVKTSVNYTLPQNVEKLIATGNAALTLTGGSQDGVTLIANNANDTLIAGTGIATLVGGNGSDTFVVNNTADVVQAQAGLTNINTIQTSVSYTASANVQKLIGTGTANITLTGNSLNDVIQGNAGNDTLIAGSGNTTLTDGTGTDTLIGGSGNDQYQLSNANDTVLLGSGFSQVNGGNGNITLTGNTSGLAFINLGSGNSQIDLSRNDNSNSVTLGNGNNIIKAGNGTNSVNVGSGQDSITLGNGNNHVTTADTAGIIDTLKLGNGCNTVNVGQGNNLITAGNGANTFTGGNGNNTVSLGSGTDHIVLGDGNNSVMTADTAGIIDTLKLGNGNNQILVGQGNDLITVGNGTNTINGGNGADTLSLGSGSNTVTLGNGNDAVTTLDVAGSVNHITLGNGADTVMGGNGANTINLGSGQDTVTLGNGNNSVTTTDTTGIVDTIKLGNGNNQVQVGQGNDLITAGNGSNTLTGGNGNNSVTLGSGTDSITLGDGNNHITTADITGIVDTLKLGNGNNTVNVGQGNDLITAGNGTNALNGGSGNNTITLGSGTDNITLGNGNNHITTADVAGIVDTLKLGNGNNQILVGQGNDLITAGNGANTITGGNGADKLSLGAGNNAVTLGNGNDQVTAGNGNNTITTGNGNSQIIVGNGRNNLTVGNGNNTLTTGNGINALHVGIGNDVINNHGGTDTLYFSPTVVVDTVNFSKSGADLLITEGITGGSVRVVGGWNNPAAGISQFVAGNGNYTVHFDNAAYNFVAGNGTDVLTGDRGNYTVTLGNGNDSVNFGNGTDQVTLGNGNSLVHVGNGNDQITAGNGNNQIHFGNGTDTVTVGNGNNLIVQGDADDEDSDFEHRDSDHHKFQHDDRDASHRKDHDVVPTDGNATIKAGDGKNIILVGNGNNQIIAGNGNNQIYYGTGTDSVKAGDGNNLIVQGQYDADDQDHDRDSEHHHEFNYAFGDDEHSEHKPVVGNDTITVGNGNNSIILGNGNNQVITGKGTNTITVGTGITTLTNHGGTDQLYLDTYLDAHDDDGVLNFTASGQDLLLSTRHGDTIARVMGGNTPAAGNTQFVVGDDNYRVNFDAANYQFIAGNGNNTIASGTGNDTITLGTGNNRITLGNGNDIITTAITPTADQNGHHDHDDGDDRGSNWINLGNGNDQVTVGNGDNVINLGNGNDVVRAGNGDNLISVGTGTDRIIVGNGNDLIVTHGGNDTLTLGTGRYDIQNIGSLDHDSIMLTAGAYNDLWFQKRGSDLVISALDSHEQITVDNWYKGEQLTSLTTSDGHSISATGINQLVQAMSAFNAPSAAQTSYTAKEQKALAPVLAANWH